jgi:hypothetical protein
MIRLVLVMTVIAGCAGVPKNAIVDGKQVPRLQLSYSGQPYDIKHEGAHPRPRGPSDGLDDAGGSIRGRVCGMLIDFDVNHRGDHVDLVGSIDNAAPAAITVTDRDGVRTFTGNLGKLAIEFSLTRDDVRGHVGIRAFVMENRGDGYAGHMRIPGLLGSGTITVRITGQAALWSVAAGRSSGGAAGDPHVQSRRLPLDRWARRRLRRRGHRSPVGDERRLPPLLSAVSAPAPALMNRR